MRHVFAVINTVGVEAVFLQMEFFCLFRTADNCNVVDFVCSPIDEADVALPHSELRVHAPFHVGNIECFSLIRDEEKLRGICCH